MSTWSAGRRECLAKGCDCGQFTTRDLAGHVCQCGHHGNLHRYRSLATPAPVRRTPRVRRVTR